MARAFILMGLLALALVLPARADMAESLRREFHSWSELGITVLTDSNLKGLDAVLRSEQTRVLVLQTSPQKLEASQARQIMDWVRQGRTIWFYDARLAPYFGMRPFMLKADQFRGRPENGQLGDKVHPGMATVVLATGSHEVLTGVGQATIWLPELEPGTYGAGSCWEPSPTRPRRAWRPSAMPPGATKSRSVTSRT